MRLDQLKNYNPSCLSIKRYRFCSQAGFSLVEILAALTILSVAITLLLLAVQSAIKQNILARKIQTATELCRKKTEELEEKFKIDGFSDLATTNGVENKSFDAPFQNYRWEVRIDPVSLGNLADAWINYAEDSKKNGTDLLGQLNSSAAAASAGAMNPLKLFLEQGLRRVTVRVSYDESNKKDGFIEVIFYATDLGRLP